MPQLNRIVLDVLKPHQPSVLEFANTIADQHPNCQVKITVSEVDEKTETTIVTIEGDDIPFPAIAETISNLGGSIHSIDEVAVNNVVKSET